MSRLGIMMPGPRESKEPSYATYTSVGHIPSSQPYCWIRHTKVCITALKQHNSFPVQVLIYTLHQTLFYPGDQKKEKEKLNALIISDSIPDGAGEGRRRPVGPIVWEMKKFLLHRVKEERNILNTIKRRNAKWIGHILRRNCLLKHVIGGKIKERI